MQSGLVSIMVKLKEALEEVELARRAVSVDLPHVGEVSFEWFLILSLIFGILPAALSHLFLSCRASRVSQPASPGSSGRSTIGSNRMRRCCGGSGSSLVSWRLPVGSPKTGRCWWPESGSGRLLSSRRLPRHVPAWRRSRWQSGSARRRSVAHSSGRPLSSRCLLQRRPIWRRLMQLCRRPWGQSKRPERTPSRRCYRRSRKSFSYRRG